MLTASSPAACFSSHLLCCMLFCSILILYNAMHDVFRLQSAAGLYCSIQTSGYLKHLPKNGGWEHRCTHCTTADRLGSKRPSIQLMMQDVHCTRQTSYLQFEMPTCVSLYQNWEKERKKRFSWMIFLRIHLKRLH